MKIASISLAGFVCALALGCSSSDDGGGSSTIDSGTAADTATSSDTGSPVDSGSTMDTGSDSGTAETSSETGGGPSCPDYCAKITANCTGDTNGQYVNTGGKSPAEICASMCAKMTLGSATDTSGDTVGCRLGFATTAGTSMPDVNCRKAGPYGGATCGASRCDDFCKLAIAQCPTAFTDEADCKTKCAAIPFDATKPEIDPTATGKLNCLFYHLEAAYVMPATHCGHLTVSAGTPCAP